MSRIFSVVALAALALGAPLATAKNAHPLVIEHVNVLPMTPGGIPLDDATVIISGGRIAAITAGAGANKPGGARRIDGRGKWLLPGFSDMHVHIGNDRMLRLYLGDPKLADGTAETQDYLTPFIANGVTQVFNLSAMSESVGQRSDVESGRVLGPHIANAAMIDGSPPSWPVGMTYSAATPEDGRQAVRDAQASGYEFIKVYSKLSLETFTAIVDEARQLKMRVVGHIPQREKGITAKFFLPGFDLVAHAEEFAQHTSPPDLTAIPAYVEMSKRNGTWLTATLTLDERIVEVVAHPESLAARDDLRYLPPVQYRLVVEHNPYVERHDPGLADYVRRVVTFNAELVRAFDAAGIPVLTGTDSPVPGVAPGFSLHDEFEALSRAGVSNRRILEATTRLPAEWLGTSGDRGTVETGKRADLVLLDANPLVDITNTRRIAAVIVNGRYLPRAELDDMMAALAARNPPKQSLSATAP
ncbi:MAG: amidohydrolase family protein [Pseudomonadota bacterium]